MLQELVYLDPLVRILLYETLDEVPRYFAHALRKYEIVAIDLDYHLCTFGTSRVF